MVGLYYLTYSSSNLSGGTNWSKDMTVENPSATYFSFAAAKNTTSTNYAFTLSTLPSNTNWESGPITVNLDINSISLGVTVSVKASRVDSIGTVLESSVASATQSISAAGVYTFTIPSMTWSAGAATDRLRIDYMFLNTSKQNPSNISINVGNGRSSISTNIEFTKAVTVNLANAIAKGSANISYWGPLANTSGGYHLDGVEISTVAGLDSDRFVVCYSKSGSNGLFARVGHVSGVTIYAIGEENAFDISTDVYKPWCCKIGTNTVLFVYCTYYATGIYAVIGEVNGDIITFGTRVLVSNTTGDFTTVKYNTIVGKAIFGFIDEVGYQMCTINCSGTTITSVGAICQWDLCSSSYGGSFDFAWDNNGCMLIDYLGSDGFQTGCYAKVTGDSFYFYKQPYHWHHPWIYDETTGQMHNTAHYRWISLVYDMDVDYLGSLPGYRMSSFCHMVSGGQMMGWPDFAKTTGTYWDTTHTWTADSTEGQIDYVYTLYLYPWNYEGTDNLTYSDPTTSCAMVDLPNSDFALMFNTGKWNNEIDHVDSGYYKIRARVYDQARDSYRAGFDGYHRSTQPFTVMDAPNTVYSAAELQGDAMDSTKAVITYRSAYSSIACQVVDVSYAGNQVNITAPSTIWGGNTSIFAKGASGWTAGTTYIKGPSGWVTNGQVYGKNQ